MDVLKTAIFLLILTLLFILIGNLIAGQAGMIVAFVLAAIMNMATYWFSDKIVLAMYRAKPLLPKDAPKVYEIVERLSEKAGIPKPRVYMIPIDTPNAFATGRNPKHAVVAVTQGILRTLTDEELEGVIAHELAHVKSRHILLASIAATIAGAIFVLARTAQFMAIFGGKGRGRSGAISLIPLLIIAIVAPLAAIMIQLAISRSSEYQADRIGGDICGKPQNLARALRKLADYSQKKPMKANPTTAHMFIVNPLRAGGFVKLFMTHPPMEERIKRLQEQASRMESQAL